MLRTPTILLAEDNSDDVLILKRALKRTQLASTLIVVEDGQQAIDYLSGTGRYSDRTAYPTPSLILLDLKMPVKTGFDVLRWMRETAAVSGVPVVVLSSSDEPQDVDKAIQLGATAYLTKPPVPEKLVELLNSVSP